MIDSIEIHNYKIIKEMTVSELGRVNLFVGANNAGKSTLLESIYLASGSNIPQCLTRINAVRNINKLNQYPWDSFFSDFRSEAIRLRSTCGNSLEKDVVISPASDAGNELSKDSNELGVPLRGVSGVSAKIAVRDGFGNSQDVSQGIRSVKDGTLRIVDDNENSLDPLSSLFVGSRDSLMPSLPHFITAVKVDKSFDVVIELLREFDPSVSDIEIGTDGIYVDIGQSKLVPLGVLGDGLVRFLGICLAVMGSKANVVLFDEIDNGLHYSNQVVLWKALLRLAEKFDVQIMATTHSIDCISSLAEAGALSESKPRLYRIERHDDDVALYDYHFDELQLAVEQMFELR